METADFFINCTRTIINIKREKSFDPYIKINSVNRRHQFKPQNIKLLGVIWDQAVIS